MSARLVLAKLLQRISPVKVQYTCLAIGFSGALIMLLSTSVFLSTFGLFLIGCGLASGFPVMLGYVGNIYTKLSGTAFSIALVLALIGGMTSPYITGAIVQAFDLRVSFVVIPISLAAIGLIFAFVLKKGEKS